MCIFILTCRNNTHCLRCRRSNQKLLYVYTRVSQFLSIQALNHVIEESEQQGQINLLNQIFNTVPKRHFTDQLAGNTRHCQQICSKQDFTRSKWLLWDHRHVGTRSRALISKHLLVLHLDHKTQQARSFFSPLQ